MVSFANMPILNYLTKRSSEQLNKLYSSPSSAFCVFRLLPSVCQICVQKAMWVGDVPKSEWKSFVNEQHQLIVGDHLKALSSLRIIEISKNVAINPIFRKSYIAAVVMGIAKMTNLRENDANEVKNRKVASKDLGKKANERWECLLYYLSLPTQKTVQGVSSTTKDLLLSSGLAAVSEVEITSAGFKFLLLSRTEQIWTYLVFFFEAEEANGNDVIPLLHFLFRLPLLSASYHSLSLYVDEISFENRLESKTVEEHTKKLRAFVIEDSWSDSLKAFLMHLRELGLIFIRKRKDGYFFITPLMSNLTAPLSAQTNVEKLKSGYIIVETNFRVYAYTNSSLQLAVLSAFTEMLYRFNDASVGVLTRESVRRALRVGISASQIISFLENNAHSISISAASSSNENVTQILPNTVVDQLRLWEDERQRLKFYNSTLYSYFESEREFEGVRDFAKNEGILLWHDNVKRLIVVTEDGHDHVKAWWKGNRLSTGGASDA